MRKNEEKCIPFLKSEQRKEPYVSISCLVEAASIVSVGRPQRVCDRENTAAIVFLFLQGIDATALSKHSHTFQMCWEKWLDSSAKFTMVPDTNYCDIIVPTMNTVRMAHLLELLLTNRKPVRAQPCLCFFDSNFFSSRGAPFPLPVQSEPNSYLIL